MGVCRCVHILNTLLKQHAHACGSPHPLLIVYTVLTAVYAETGQGQQQDSEMSVSECVTMCTCVSSHSEVRSSTRGEGDC